MRGTNKWYGFSRFIRSPLTLMLNPNAIRLVNELDGLPLTLATARAYLDQAVISFLDYLQLYKTL
jgi:hypothetical protein